jgi:hypothetical protein
VRVLDMLGVCLSRAGIQHARIDGASSDVARAATIADYNRPSCRVPVCLLTTKTGEQRWRRLHWQCRCVGGLLTCPAAAEAVRAAVGDGVPSRHAAAPSRWRCR